jgi:hypothetical protein
VRSYIQPLEILEVLQISRLEIVEVYAMPLPFTGLLTMVSETRREEKSCPYAKNRL